MKNIAIVILAAGKGTRMAHDTLPKVLVPLKNKPLLEYVLNTAEELKPNKIIAIIGYLKETIIDFCTAKYPNVEYAIQESQLGTGHAVLQTKEILQDYKGDILILAGDVPLIKTQTLKKFTKAHRNSGNALSVLSTIATVPYGYGRIVRDKNFEFIKIVEERDANETEAKIKEINSGIYLVNAQKLFWALGMMNNNNAQKEYYLTDIVQIFNNESHKIAAYCLAEFNELQGINSKDDLIKVESLLEK